MHTIQSGVQIHVAIRKQQVGSICPVRRILAEIEYPNQQYPYLRHNVLLTAYKYLLYNKEYRLQIYDLPVVGSFVQSGVLDNRSTH